MGAIIPKNKKIKYLPYIKSNFIKLSQRKIARRLNIGKTTVNRWSKELGLTFQKHTVNENFFDKLTEESTYILGFIYADGNIAWNPKKGYYTLTITSAEKDKNHLEAIRNHISSTKPLLYSEKTKSYRLIANSKILCEKLMKLGVMPKKSLTMVFPDIQTEFIQHFIRGVIDGDGNVRYVNRKRSPYFEITIASGSKMFLEKLINVVNREINTSANIKQIGKNTYQVQYSCSRGEKLANYIYNDVSIYLERKRKEYEKIGGDEKNDS